MKIETTRFGELNVDKKDIINFTESLLGFENLKRFFIVDPGDQTLILWLQSLDNIEIAFPIMEPQIFKPDYSAKLSPLELQSLNLESSSQASFYTVITIPKEDVTNMSANLKAPIVINNETKEARQIVLQDNKLEISYPMYSPLKAYISNYISDDSTKTKNTPVKMTDLTKEQTKPINTTKKPSQENTL